MDIETCDIDAKLLEQFTALGTTDKDELISQLRCIIGNDVTVESSRFFLELAGWNLQRAVGAYFDFSFENSPTVGCPALTIGACTSATDSITVYSSTVAIPERCDVRIYPNGSEEFIFSTSLSFVCENTGITSWHQGTFLKSQTDIGIAKLATCSSNGACAAWKPIGDERRLVAPLHPSQCTELTIEMTPPSMGAFCSPGTYIAGAINFCQPSGEIFGEIIYCTAMFDGNTQRWLYSRGVHHVAAAEPATLTPMEEA